MDIVTHGLVGALVARAVATRAPWPMIAAGIGGAFVPDLDVVAGLWDPLAAITVHRTATHSLVGGVPLALGVAGALRASGARAGWWRLAAVAYLGVLSHIGLDLLTPFGTAVFWPLAPRRFTLGALYVIDAIVIGVVVAGLVVSFRSARFRTAGARGALLALVAYAVLAGAMSRAADARFRHWLDARGMAPVRAAVIPVFPGPVRWLGVAEADGTVYQGRFWVGGAPPERLPAFPPVALDGEWRLERLPEVRTFRAFARFPWRTVASAGTGRIVEYRDLAFEDHPFGGPMALRLRLDASGVVRDIHLGHRL